MGARSLTIAIFALSFCLSARAGMQFAPRESEYTVEGMKFKQLAFSDDSGKEITYQQPPGWDYAGDAAKLRLHPPNKSQAQGAITKVALPQPGLFDEKTTKTLTEEALASVPQGSTEVTLVSQEKNPVKIGGKETFLLIISYTFSGEHYKRSLMFLNREHEQIRFEFVSRAADFEELQRTFLASQFTWCNL